VAVTALEEADMDVTMDVEMTVAYGSLFFYFSVAVTALVLITMAVAADVMTAAVSFIKRLRILRSLLHIL